ncbi:uncharacterized protein C1orf158 homolog [Onychomys torridus]|uniref:uncharacterized protein C1orf158 homolog n=1 Tax=Onychomys torridus TaxID=38674 RepID=UPI00167F2EE7|nr:uncharacterized protein C1orf158 homolog [Onychomys torridus]
MFTTAAVPQTFSTPSWQIEKQYSTRVLIGNWVEERRKFTKATDHTPQCIYRKEYVPFPSHRPDHISRWYGKRRVEGLPYKHLITHHQEPSNRYLISTYDDHYNRHNYNPGVPALRTWNGQKLLWLPEKSDFPLLAPPTNYGLLEQLKQKWLVSKTSPRESIYTTSYPRLPVCAMSRREHAIPVPPPRLHPTPHF